MTLDYYSLDYDSFLKWALIKEPILKEKKPLNELPEDITPSGISDYTRQQTTIAFEEALNRCASLKRYMRDFNYINLIFNYALHISIVSSAFEIKKDDDTEGGQTSGNIWNEPTLYKNSMFNIQFMTVQQVYLPLHQAEVLLHQLVCLKV